MVVGEAEFGRDSDSQNSEAWPERLNKVEHVITRDIAVDCPYDAGVILVQLAGGLITGLGERCAAVVVGEERPAADRKAEDIREDLPGTVVGEGVRGAEREGWEWGGSNTTEP